MHLELVTPPASEPVTLAQAKAHLRLASPAGDVTATNTIDSGSHGTTVVGTGIDIQGYTAVAMLDVGVLGTGQTLTAKIQHSTDNSTWEDAEGGAFTTVTEFTDLRTHVLAYTGDRQYIRVTTTPSASITYGAQIILTPIVTDEDSQIERLITVARKVLEQRTEVGLITQTWKLVGDCFPECIHIPKWPLRLLNGDGSAATSITYVDTSGSTQTLATSVYKVTAPSRVPGKITLKAYQFWPVTYPEADVVQVTFKVGFDTTSEELEPARQAILHMVAEMYENREQSVRASTIESEPVKYAIDYYAAGMYA